MQGAENQLEMGAVKMKNLSEATEIRRQKLKIADLQRTIETLKEEASRRREKVQRLNARRTKLLDDIAYWRNQQRRNAINLYQHFDKKIRNCVHQVHRINDELGPFRLLHVPFYLE